jgi:hypothetical protein
MLRWAQIRSIIYATLAGLTFAAAGIACLFGSVIAEGRELSAVEDIALDLLIGAVIFLTLGGLVSQTN